MQWPRSRRKAAVALDFQPRIRSPRAGWLLLALACVFAADVARNHAEDQARTRKALQALAKLPVESATAPGVSESAYQPKDLERESAFARGVITRMSMPWNDLFRALQATKVDNVELLSVEPDADARTVRISAEARDIPAMLTYLARLESERYFQRTGLVQQEAKRDARGGISFVVSATWRKT